MRPARCQTPLYLVTFFHPDLPGPLPDLPHVRRDRKQLEEHHESLADTYVASFHGRRIVNNGRAVHELRKKAFNGSLLRPVLRDFEPRLIRTVEPGTAPGWKVEWRLQWGNAVDLSLPKKHVETMMESMFSDSMWIRALWLNPLVSSPSHQDQPHQAIEWNSVANLVIGPAGDPNTDAGVHFVCREGVWYVEHPVL